MITVYTQVYNTPRNYLAKCLESVLNQTYTDFEYLLADNGSTDGSYEILKQYALKDKRIRLFHFDTNNPYGRWEEIKEHICGDYISVVDSDDWVDPDYLKQLCSFAEINDLDIACASAVFHQMDSGRKSLRRVNADFIVPRESYGEFFPYYHVFFRTNWGKLIKSAIVREIDIANFPCLSYGADTLFSFGAIRKAKRFGITSMLLYNYRVRSDSLSYHYNKLRFQSDLYLYEDAKKFLLEIGGLTLFNENFIYKVFANALLDTVNVIKHSDLENDEKMRAYWEIAGNPVTMSCYKINDEQCRLSRKMLLQEILELGNQRLETGALALEPEVAGSEPGASDLHTQELFKKSLQYLCPHCIPAILAADDAVLGDARIHAAFLEDERNMLVDRLLDMFDIKARHCEKNEILGQMLQSLAYENCFLFQIGSIDFMISYKAIYSDVFKGKLEDALDKMSGLLLEEQVKQEEKTFLELYINLAAKQELPDAFVLGKILMSKLYLRCGEEDEYRKIMAELNDMGIYA